jgi:hypothetical protein
MTGVLLQTTPTELSVAYGTPDDERDAQGRRQALYRPGRLVAYLARNPPTQALYLFKTAGDPGGTDRLRHVSHPVRLLYVANTSRTAGKAATALRVLRKRIGDAGIDALPDIFWLRLADFIERRGKKIAGYVTALLDRQQLV